jgi:exodeoxyribonuclease VII large subunit
VIVYPTQVQGEAAIDQIVNSIYIANQRREVDVLIVGRGGGSLEDLWCFNEEKVARAIFASQLPIVSAVGHEVDVTIADFVADARAATPSQAAELVSRDMSEVLLYLQQTEEYFAAWLRQTVQNLGYQLQVLSSRLQQNHPKHKLQQQQQRVDQLTMQLQSSMQRRIQQQQHFAQHLQTRLAQHNPTQQLRLKQQQLQNLEQRLAQTIKQQCERKHQTLGRLSSMLHSVSPLATLGRGYSITFKGDDVVQTIEQLNPGDEITTQIHKGTVRSQVLSTKA